MNNYSKHASHPLFSLSIGLNSKILIRLESFFNHNSPLCYQPRKSIKDSCGTIIVNYTHKSSEKVAKEFMWISIGQAYFAVCGEHILIIQMETRLMEARWDLHLAFLGPYFHHAECSVRRKISTHNTPKKYILRNHRRFSGSRETLFGFRRQYETFLNV